MMRPIINIALIFVAALIFTGCGQNRSRAADNILTVGIEDMPTNLDPRFAKDAHSMRIAPLIFSSLVRLDDSGLPVGDLAESFETPDAVTYRFKLRSGVVFHNGDKFDCRDVKYTFENVSAPDSKSPYRSDFEKIQSLTCESEFDLTIRLKETFAPIMTSLQIGILPRGVDPEFIRDHPIGSGPFKFESAEEGKSIKLSRFENYYGTKPKLAAVVFRVLPNSVTRALELESGGVDLLQNSLSPEFIEYLAAKKGIRIERRDGINYNYLGFNLDHPILKKREVREAIARSIDRDAIIKYLWRGTAQSANNLLAPSNWAYNPDTVAYPYSPDVAKKLLDDAGFPDPDGDGPAMRFNLSYKTSTDRLRRRIAETIKSQLAAVGIGVDVRSYEWGTFYNDIGMGNFEIYSLALVGIREPDIFWSVFNSANIPPNGSSMNRNRFRNAGIDRLTELGRSTTDIAERKRIYAEIQKIATVEIPFVGLYYTDDIAAMRDCVRGWKINPGGDFRSLPLVWIEK